jgi:hypothetical protein
MPLKKQSVKKQAISKYYFSIASIKSSKEPSNFNKIVCFAGVNDTGELPEKSNISANIRKKLKSSLGLPTLLKLGLLLPNINLILAGYKYLHLLTGCEITCAKQS